MALATNILILLITFLITLCHGKCSSNQNLPLSVTNPTDQDEVSPAGNEALSSEASSSCVNGDCVDDKCVCYDGWKGELCDSCHGRILLTDEQGFIHDGLNNYSVNSECTWLIRPKLTSTTIKLTFSEFASECGWDYLYIYDGDSIYSPLIASFNGILRLPGNTSPAYPEVMATSGSVLLYFFSDAAYTMSGFNISYLLDSCPNNCSNHGKCNVSVDGGLLCLCESGWYGESCDVPLCNCTSNTNDICATTETTQCKDQQNYWVELISHNGTFGHASHSSVFHNYRMYVFGGLQYGTAMYDGVFVSYYDTLTATWVQPVVNGNQPMQRYGLSSVLLADEVYIFGGRLIAENTISDQVWKFNLLTNAWTMVNYTMDFDTLAVDDPLALWGHSATLLKLNGQDIVVIMFGYHNQLEYSGFVYEFNIADKKWIRPVTYGYPLTASFGHTSTYDEVSHLIYVVDGYRKVEKTLYSMSTNVYAYNPVTKYFTKKRSGSLPRYLHASVFVNGQLFVFGGSTHNDTDKSLGALCFSSNMMSYDPTCDSWQNLPSPTSDQKDYSRYGLSAVEDDSGNVLIYGGFDGTILSSTLSYITIDCTKIVTQLSCDQMSSCVWSSGRCASSMTCPSLPRDNTCSSIKNGCSACLSSDDSCVYCNGICAESCKSAVSISDVSLCDDTLHGMCSRLMNQLQCESVTECVWSDNQCIVYDGAKNKSSETSNTCGFFTSCSNCTTNTGCMWCANREECVSTNAYVIQFPYGECRKWMRQNCDMPVTCEGHRMCGQCNIDPACGWCDDGSGTGTGECFEGGYSGPVNATDTSSTYPPLAPNVCKADHWFFIGCPPCQCNGHSSCDDDSESVCEECEDNTSGDHCETCDDGYYGDSTNGGMCDKCFCNNHGDMCDRKSGRCNCDTKGIVGETCDRCDQIGKYFGDPLNNGTCFYKLLINYSFTFSLNQQTDKYVEKINYENTPTYSSNVELSLEAQSMCNVRLTIQQNTPTNASRKKRHAGNDTEHMTTEYDVETFIGVTSVQYSFNGDKYDFGTTEAQSTIRIYVSNFTFPTKITVSLVQRNGNLLLLLLVLFSVFLVLLLITATVWKLKLLYDNYTRQQAHQVELEQMAARPFSAVHLDCNELLLETGDETRVLQVEEPTAIAEQIVGHDEARVMSVLMWMPLIDGFQPSASSLMIGSTLVASTPHQHAHTKQKNKIKDKFRVVFKKQSVDDTTTQDTTTVANSNDNNSEQSSSQDMTQKRSVAADPASDSRSDECVEVRNSKTNRPAYDNPTMMTLL